MPYLRHVRWNGEPVFWMCSRIAAFDGGGFFLRMSVTLAAVAAAVAVAAVAAMLLLLFLVLFL
jgi:hypothetical protein